MFADSDLTGTRFDGALLNRVSFESSDLSDADFGHSILHETDFSNSVGLTQSMLEMAIGDENTTLPSNNGEPLFVWSCWVELPTSIAKTLSIFPKSRQEQKKREWLCGPEGRKKTGRTAEP